MTSTSVAARPPGRLPEILVGVPVYRGLEETRRCLESVRAAGLPPEARLFVLNDASPDEALCRWLRDWCSREGIQLEEWSENRGFVAAANRICDVAGQMDVILLNADTQVTGNWIERLSAAAQSCAEVATVTPFSNNGTLASYPKPWISQAMPEDPAAIDAACRAANAGRTVRLPVGVGFCLYLTRAALQRVGRFSEAAFGRGYGEEVDFCLRANALGMVHLLAADTFVAHEGAISFGPQSAEGQRTGEARLLERHPDFHALIEDFRKADPLAPLRERVTRQRLARSPLPRVLMVSHAWDGGVWQHIESLAALLRGRVEVVSLRPASAQTVRLEWLKAGECWRAEAPADLASLREVLGEIGFSRIHVHHLRDHVVPMEALAVALGIPLDVTLHDYHLLSRHYQLLDDAGRFDESLVDSQSGDFRRGERLLQAADRVLAPSGDVADRHARFIPAARYTVEAHPEQPAVRVPRPLRIGVLGALSRAKGLGLLEAAARQAQETGRPLHFVLVGYAVDEVSTWPAIPLEIRGEYSAEELPARLAAEALDVVWFPALWPETFSYTLSAVLDAGLRIVAPRLGAFTERLETYPLGRLVAPDAEVGILLDALAEAASLGGSAPLRADNREHYSGMYLAPLAKPATPRDAAVGDLPATPLPEAGAGRTASDLVGLFTNGIDRGHRGSVEQLRQEIARLQALEQQAALAARHHAQREAHVAELGEAIEAFKAECVRLEKESQAQQSAAEQVQRELKEALRSAQTETGFHRRRVEDLESSTSWRVTAPLRSAGEFVKRVRQRIARFRALFEISGRRLVIARDILVQQGPHALYRRVRARLGQGKPVQQPPTWKYRLAENLAPLSVPQAAHPLVSIVIPVHGQHQHTFSCLQSLVEHTALPVEVIVIDDVSPIPVADALHPVTGVRWLRNLENQGFIRNCNLGAREARGEYLVLLNNDTLVTAGWLEALLRPLQQDTRVGVVGAKLIFPDGRLQEAGGIVWRDGSAWNYGRGDDPSKAEYNYIREVDYVSGACFAVRRQDFLSAGGFDEAFAPAYCEDSDYCLRAVRNGQKVIYQPACTVVHFEGVSNGTDTSGGLKAYQVRNSRLLFERWKAKLSHHRSNGMLPNLERERGVSRRLLYIDATMVTPDQDSGSVRVRGVLKTAREHGCKVTFIADNLEYKSPYVEDLQQLGVEVRYWPELRSIEDYLAEEGAFFDVVILSRYYVADKHIAAVRRLAPQALVALDTHDLHYLRLRRLAELEPSSAHTHAAEEAYAKEMAIMQACDVTLVVSPVELELLAREQPGLDVRVFTNIHEVADQVPPHADRAGMMFVGGYRHPPNIDAVLWYAREVLPLVKQRLPGVKTYIIGSNAPPEILALADEALEIVGFVPDMTPYLEKVRVSISPLRYGAGVKGKINQAMAHGLPVVGTSPSVEGMFLRDGVEVLVADAPEDFAAAIERLHNDAALWQRLSEASQDNVRNHFSAEAAWRVIDGMMADAERRR